MGVVLAPFLIVALVFGPAIAILKSKGPSLATRASWAVLSLAAVAIYVGAEVLLWRTGHQGWAEFSRNNGAFINVAVYVFPFCIFILFWLLNSSSINTARSSHMHDLDARRIRSLRRSVHIGMSLFAVFLLLSYVLDLSAEIQLSLSPVVLALYIWIAVSIGRLASAIQYNGVMWGLVSAVLPMVGMIVAYLFIGIGSAKYQS